MTYDVVIVGGGAAGLTAALFAARRGLSTVVITQDIGGQASMASVIENYPGVSSMRGTELMDVFRAQAERDGATVVFDEVTALSRSGDDFIVTTRQGSYSAHAVILAFGLTRRHLNIPGETELIGKGVTMNATLDAPAFKGKSIAVVGGGNSAQSTALLLSDLCTHVDLITENPELRGEQVTVDRVHATKNITVHYGAHVKSIEGSDAVSSLTFDDQHGTEQRLAVQGVAVEIGFTVNVSFLQDFVALDQRKQIVVGSDNATSVPGVFAAGDATTIDQKQVIISAGEGARSALSVFRYLQARGLVQKGGTIDWGKKKPSAKLQ